MEKITKTEILPNPHVALNNARNLQRNADLMAFERYMDTLRQVMKQLRDQMMDTRLKMQTTEERIAKLKDTPEGPKHVLD